jgi:quercetin dioxygenase-like cupin family protein
MESNIATATEKVPTSNNLRPAICHITTHSPETHKSTIHSSNPPSWIPIGTQNRLNPLYSNSSARPNLSTDKDIEAHTALISSRPELGLVQPNGSVCCMIEIAPDSHPYMHRTQSLDYVIVVAGEVELIMEDGQKRVCGVGDVVVQRGTKHAWRNTSSVEWARFVAVVIGCEKIELDGEVLEEDMGRGEKSDTSS